MADNERLSRMTPHLLQLERFRPPGLPGLSITGDIGTVMHRVIYHIVFENDTCI